MSLDRPKDGTYARAASIIRQTFPRILSIDPSVNNLGYAYFDMGAGEHPYNLSGWEYGTLYLHGKWIQHRWRDAYRQLSERLDGSIPTHLACEWPSFFNTEKGIIAAKMGYTLDLASIVGYLTGKFQIKADYVALWTPGQWKGQVPKSVTLNKFVRLFGEGARKAIKLGIGDDTVDAIMILEHWLELYNREKFSWQHQKQIIASHSI
jgi:hypothetical protein